jgi:hypothetical protein
MTKEIGLIGGVENRLIEIQNYDSDWSKKFEMHADHLPPSPRICGMCSTVSSNSLQIIDITMFVKL